MQQRRSRGGVPSFPGSIDTTRDISTSAIEVAPLTEQPPCQRSDPSERVGGVGTLSVTRTFTRGFGNRSGPLEERDFSVPKTVSSRRFLVRARARP